MQNIFSILYQYFLIQFTRALNCLLLLILIPHSLLPFLFLKALPRTHLSIFCFEVILNSTMSMQEKWYINQLRTEPTALHYHSSFPIRYRTHDNRMLLCNVFNRVQCTLFFNESYDEILPENYTWKILQNGLKINFAIRCRERLRCALCFQIYALYLITYSTYIGMVK